MQLASFQPCSLIDYPGQVCATVFTQGCSWRCPFCHNPSLLPPRGPCSLDPVDWQAFLDRRAGRLGAVCVTGGEPTEHDDLPAFLAALKQRGLQVKLDTNGSRPDTLRRIIDRGLVDYLAMDIKGPLDDYARFAGVDDFDAEALRESIALLRTAKVAYEFRTTVIPGWHNPASVARLARPLRGASALYLQAFQPQHAPTAALRATPPASRELLQTCAQAAAALLPIRLRGLG